MELGRTSTLQMARSGRMRSGIDTSDDSPARNSTCAQVTRQTRDACSWSKWQCEGGATGYLGEEAQLPWRLVCRCGVGDVPAQDVTKIQSGKGVTYSCGTSAPSRAPVLVTLNDTHTSKWSAPPHSGGGGRTIDMLP